MTHFNEIKSAVRELFYVFRKINPDYISAINQSVNAVLGEGNFKIEDIVHGGKIFTSFEELKSVLIKQLEEEVNLVVDIGEHHSLVDNKDHIDWYREKKASENIKFNFWNRYRKYLINAKGWAENTVDDIDTTTDDIIEKLEDPTISNRSFDRRGLVVGYVQSGKTANFMGVINKAIDSGYRVIVVLAGIHNNLRYQTQERIDEEVIGRDSSPKATEMEKQMGMGVTTLPNSPYYPVTTFTIRDEKGDFNKKFAKQIGGIQPNTNQPMLLVVKKNKSVLDSLVKYFRECIGTLDPKYVHKDSSGNVFINNLPLLVVDDEADQASVNTRKLKGNNDEETDPTAINKEIRKLLNLFRQKAYVGYTATPFANIFIPHKTDHSEFGIDLFPSSFITTLDAPSNYFGPKRVFGLKDNSESPGLPIYRSVLDAGGKETQILPIGHRANDNPTQMPQSMKEAIRAFIIASAIRRLRGQGQKHNTMLIHSTRFNIVQKAIGELVDNELQKLRNAINNDDADVLAELKNLWQKDFVKTSTEMGNTLHTWEEILPHIRPAVIKIEPSPLIINGKVGDILEYKQKENTGLSVIAIGGDKLSRGLTLEGLTISYFTRSTSIYDTLMQMGRWFGYRLGFEDVCRIYTTPDLYSWYQHISSAFESLREEFIEMKNQKLTPKDFGLRVMAHPDMMITNTMKMRYSEEVKLSYRGTLTETSSLPSDNEKISFNYDLTEKFINQLGSANINEVDSIVWKNVESSLVIEFFNSFITHQSSPQASAKRISNYIKRQNDKENAELLQWNVSLVTLKKEQENGSIKFSNFTINPTSRGVKENPKTDKRLFIKRLVDNKDELVDFTEEDRIRFKENQITNRQTRGQGIRKTHPLLSIYLIKVRDFKSDEVLVFDKMSIGFAVSWSDSPTLSDITYRINTVAQELDIVEDEN